MADTAANQLLVFTAFFVIIMNPANQQSELGGNQLLMLILICSF